MLFVSVVGLASLLSISAPALAGRKRGHDGAPAEGASRTTQEKAARKACLSGDYAKGVDILSELFVDTKDPTYLFNQGRCFEQNRRYEDAMARFQEYLRVGQGRIAESDRASAEQHITDCKAMLPAQTVATGAAPETFTPPPPLETLPPPPTPHPVPSDGLATNAQPVTNSGKGWRAAGIITASVGAAGLVAGLVLNLSANAAVSDMESKPDGYSPSKSSTQQSLKTGGWIAYGVGGACVVAGAILYGIGVAKAAPPRKLAVLPTISVGQAGAAIVGAF